MFAGDVVMSVCCWPSFPAGSTESPLFTSPVSYSDLRIFRHVGQKNMPNVPSKGLKRDVRMRNSSPVFLEQGSLAYRLLT